MALLLQFFGISDSLNLFRLEQGQPAGPVFAGFAPVSSIAYWDGANKLPSSAVGIRSSCIKPCSRVGWKKRS